MTAGLSLSTEGLIGTARRHIVSSEALLLFGGHWVFNGAVLGTAERLFTTTGGLIGRESGRSGRRDRSVIDERVGRAWYATSFGVIPGRWIRIEV